MTSEFPQLPLLPEPLIGREAELLSLVQVWFTARLVTIYGQSGVGKSVLARAAARQIAAGEAGRVCYLDASGAKTGAAILRMLARVDRRSGASSRDVDTHPLTLDEERLLFVLLDGLAASAREASRGMLQWLVSHPNAHMLVVTRRPLDLLGEQARPVTPLGAPLPGAITGPAVDVFTHCASRAQHEPPVPNAELVAEICRALDGLPAALEAAACLVGILPEHEIARIARDEPLSLVLRGEPLQAILAATWDDLPAEDREYLAANALWPGAFSAEAGAALSSPASSPAAARLLAIGLLRIESRYPLTYRMSPLIRTLALQQAGARERQQQRMARYLLDVAEGEAMTTGGMADGPAACRPTLAAELPSLCWAWRWLAGSRDGEGLLRFAGALAEPLAGPLGAPAEGRELLLSALAHARVAERDRAPALEAKLAGAECRLGQLDLAEGRLNALLELSLAPEAQAQVHLHLGGVLASRGQLTLARNHRLMVLSLLRGPGADETTREAPARPGAAVRRAAGAGTSAEESGSSHAAVVCLAWALHGLAENQRRLRIPAAAWAALHESADLFSRVGCPVGGSAVLAAFGELHADQDEWEEAAWHAAESQAQSEAVGDRPGTARALLLSARVAGRKDPARGCQLAQAAVNMWEAMGRPFDGAAALLDLVELAHAAGYPPAQALSAARAALRLARRDGYAALEAAALLALACVYHRAGRPDRTAFYAAEARDACERTDDELVRYRCRLWEQSRAEADNATTAPGDMAGVRTSEAPLMVRLLGPLTVEGPGGVLTTGSFRPREQRVLGRLAMDPGRPVTRDELLDLFWPNSPFAPAERSLRTVVSALRRRLRSVIDGKSPRLISARLDGYCLEPAACTVDASVFARAVEVARAAPSDSSLSPGALAAWREAVELYRGDLLSGFPYEDWCLTARERLRDDFLDGLFQLARHCLVTGCTEEARVLAARMVEIDATEERAHRLLMRSYAALDRPAESLRQYQRCAAALQEELGARPAPATNSLLEAIRAGASFRGDDEGEEPPRAPGTDTSAAPIERLRSDQ
jgi:DNA-binding SARP family transcriptional activator